MWYLLFDVCWTAIPRSSYASANPPDLLGDSVLNQVLFAWVTACNSAWVRLAFRSIFQYLGSRALETYLRGCLKSSAPWLLLTSLKTHTNFSIGRSDAILGGIRHHGTLWPVYPSRLASPDGTTERCIDCSRYVGQILAPNVTSSKWTLFLTFADLLLMRADQSLNIPFTLITRSFPIQKGTFLSRYTQLSLAFIFSGLIHHIGALNLPTSSREGNYRQLAFFLMQPGAIMFEDLAIHLGRKAGIKSSCKSWHPYSSRPKYLHIVIPSRENQGTRKSLDLRMV